MLLFRYNTSIDCLTSDYTVEFDFAPKWAESMGQSLYYANMTNLKTKTIMASKFLQCLNYDAININKLLEILKL